MNVVPAPQEKDGGIGMRSLRYRFALALVAPLAVAPSWASVIWDESLNGDLSNDRFNPTAFTLSPGTSSLIATSGADPDTGDMDREFFAFTIPDGFVLSEVRLAAYAGEDEIAFIGLVTGPIMTVDPESPAIEELYGWTLFGPLVLPVGSDYLPRMGSAQGAIGFTPPLSAGVYSWWSQQLSPPVTYQWDFVVAPEPGTASLLAVGLLLCTRRR